MHGFQKRVRVPWWMGDKLYKFPESRYFQFIDVIKYFTMTSESPPFPYMWIIVIFKSMFSFLKYDALKRRRQLFIILNVEYIKRERKRFHFFICHTLLCHFLLTKSKIEYYVKTELCFALSHSTLPCLKSLNMRSHNHNQSATLCQSDRQCLVKILSVW